MHRKFPPAWLTPPSENVPSDPGESVRALAVCSHASARQRPLIEEPPRGDVTTWFSRAAIALVLVGALFVFPADSPAGAATWQCGAKGFDAVETDIDEEYTSPSGFPLTKAEEESYMTTLADYMHGLGLG